MEIAFLLSKDKEILYQEHSHYVGLNKGKRKGKEMEEGDKREAKGNKQVFLCIEGREGK